ncbi:hypothetical protein Csa_003538 [Cucumis sativus]|uniref:Uncharacterized protein n=1 Tax=Cucumis sativus TaxID=3659 RepID=A0A0A0KG63_CUCSA|nr:hypothetical protein Csa_003538 [Cucumis sativus]
MDLHNYHSLGRLQYYILPSILNLLRQSLVDELEFCFSRNGDFHLLSTVASFSCRYSLVAFHLSQKTNPNRKQE